MKRHNGPHINPGELLRDEVIQERGLTIEEGAILLGISTDELNKIYCGENLITKQIAIKISQVFGGNSELWIRIQNSFLNGSTT